MFKQTIEERGNPQIYDGSDDADVAIAISGITTATPALTKLMLDDDGNVVVWDEVNRADIIGVLAVALKGPETTLAYYKSGTFVKPDEDETPTPGTIIIDMTTETLDPRLTYTGPPHYYFDSTGKLVLSAENEWPLEYRNGVAVGRHDPEPAATNKFNINSISSGRVVVSAVTGNTGLPGFLATERAESGSHFMLPLIAYEAGQVFTMSLFAEKTDKSRDYAYMQVAHPALTTTQAYSIFSFNDGAISWVGNPIQSGVSAQSSVISDGILSVSSTMTPEKSTNGTVETTPFGSSMSGSNVYLGDTGYSMVYSGIQVEFGDLRTSPILATDGTASRIKSYVTVPTPDTSFIVLVYNDGSIEGYDTPDDSFELPVAKRPWSDRYIDSIELGN